MIDKALLNIVNKVHNLPTLPQVVESVMSMVEDPNASAVQLAEVISKDQALMAKVLRVVNSAYTGMPKEITTLKQATVILGFNTIKNLVLSASIFDTFGKGDVNNRFDRVKFWEHSIGTAVGAKVLAKRIGSENPEEMFIAGLVHDIGKIIIDEYLHNEFLKILDLVDARQIRILEAENEILGVGHPQLGEWVARKWNLPLNLVECIAFHHSPQLAVNSKERVAIVHIANAIPRIEGIGFGGDNQTPIIDPDGWATLQIPAEDLGELIVTIKKEFEVSSIFMSLTS